MEAEQNNNKTEAQRKQIDSKKQTQPIIASESPSGRTVKAAKKDRM